MSGVPRIIHTKVLVIHLIGFILDIEPKVITSPSGRAHRSVMANICRVTRKPSARFKVTSRNDIDYFLFRNLFWTAFRRYLRATFAALLFNYWNAYTSARSYFSASAKSVPSATSSSIAVLILARSSVSSRRIPIAYSSGASSTLSTIIRSA